jgi:hypothetical protein
VLYWGMIELGQVEDIKQQCAKQAEKSCEK